ncbi:MAG TPA: mechanosensitive ion channel domain-containing protein [Bryobacteraceae bacterium]|jgi:small-conductance mechanosensitive channel|nr:mechanosensitive ion channel domain-containing protein [Bryobacteraceae bacterium]
MNKTFRTVIIGIAILGVLIALSLLNASGVISFSGYGTRAWKLWTQPLFMLGTLPVTAVFLVKSAVFMLCLIVSARVGRSVLKTRILTRTSIDPGLQYAIEVGTGYFIFVVGLIIGLQSVGLNLSSLAFFTGIVGVGVGFGTQNIMNNFVSGLILLIERPIKVGDRIEVGDLTGDIVRIGARSTWVSTNDNIIIIVPNADFISNRVTNWTANDRRVRIGIPVGVGYSSDPAMVRELLLKIAGSRREILMDPPPDVIFVGFGDSSLDFDLRVWTMERLRTPQILKSDLYYDIFRVFAEHQIELPFPQRDVHVRSIEAPLPVVRPKPADRATTIT